MEFLEKDLESIIWESCRFKLSERGLNISGLAKRQLRVGNFGILDLVTFERKKYPYWDGSDRSYIEITVYELKKGMIGIPAFMQAVRYCKGIKTYLRKNKPEMPFKFKIVLIGKEIDLNNDFIYLEDLVCDYSLYPHRNISSVEFYTYSYGVDGLEFNIKSDYNLSNTGF